MLKSVWLNSKLVVHTNAFDTFITWCLSVRPTKTLSLITSTHKESLIISTHKESPIISTHKESIFDYQTILSSE